MHPFLIFSSMANKLLFPV